MSGALRTDTLSRDIELILSLHIFQVPPSLVTGQYCAPWPTKLQGMGKKETFLRFGILCRTWMPKVEIFEQGNGMFPWFEMKSIFQ